MKIFQKFMKRKVYLVGQNTLTVSLPSKWVKQNNVKKGAELEITEDGKSIIISPDRLEQQKKKRKFSFKQGAFIADTIKKSYRFGCNEMVIEYSDPDKVAEDKLGEHIKGIIADLIGADIIDSIDNKVYVNITDPDYKLDIKKELTKVISNIENQIKIIQEHIKLEKFDRDKINYFYRLNSKKMEYTIRNAFINKEPHETFVLIEQMAYLINKISVHFSYFYRIHLPYVKNIKGKKELLKYFDKTTKILNGVKEKINRKVEKKETEDYLFRRNLEDVQQEILQKINDPKITGSLLVLPYYTLEKLAHFIEFLYVYVFLEKNNE